jgi:recombination protein RecA
VSAQILTLKLPSIEAVPLAEQLFPSAGAFAAALPAGRLIEIARTADGAQMTMAIACLRQAQMQAEPVAWVQRTGGALFPPDLVDSGIDLDALLVVHVGNGKGSEHDLAKAAELLLRSGAFGMVVIDLTAVPVGASANVDSAPSQQARNGLELAVQSRLLGLAREHRCNVLLLSERGNRSGSLGPLVSLCIEPKRTRVGRGAFAIEPHARKDKSGLLCALAVEARRGPWGLW